MSAAVFLDGTQIDWPVVSVMVDEQLADAVYVNEQKVWAPGGVEFPYEFPFGLDGEVA